MIEYEGKTFDKKPLPYHQWKAALKINARGGHGADRVRTRAILKVYEDGNVPENNILPTEHPKKIALVP